MLDNLRRRGSETNLTRWRAEGVHFVHGDVRVAADLEDLDGAFDVRGRRRRRTQRPGGLGRLAALRASMRTCSARSTCSSSAAVAPEALLFLSTSRVYSIEPLRGLALTETPDPLRAGTRPSHSRVPAPSGVSEAFPTDTCPLVLRREQARVASSSSRSTPPSTGCGPSSPVAASSPGAGQFGKAEQGVFAMWAANHVLGLPLRYIGFGGARQAGARPAAPGRPHRPPAPAARGDRELLGLGSSTPAAGRDDIGLAAGADRDLPRGQRPTRWRSGPSDRTSAVNVPLYITDNARVTEELGWRPTTTPAEIIGEIVEWVRSDVERSRRMFSTEKGTG